MCIIQLGRGFGFLAALMAITSAPAQRSEHRPVPSPDGSRIAFMSKSDATDGDWELFVMDRDGRNLRRLTDNPGWDGYAVWSPDGHSLTFDRSLTGDDDNKAAHLLDLASGSVTRLAEREGWFAISDWRGDYRVAFWERDGQRDLYLTNAEDIIVRQLTATPDTSEHDAQFSPDGRTIAFASGPIAGGGTFLELLDIESGDRRILRESAGRIYGPSWSPDGRRIAYTDAPGGADDDADIFVLTLETGAVEAMARDDGWDHMPVWTANGAAIVFTSYRSGEERMYVTYGPGTAMRLWAGDAE
ncbi:MAG: hypothetical protein AAGE05_12525 [Pseudomonadota bacterium]